MKRLIFKAAAVLLIGVLAGFGIARFTHPVVAQQARPQKSLKRGYHARMEMAQLNDAGPGKLRLKGTFFIGKPHPTNIPGLPKQSLCHMVVLVYDMDGNKVVDEKISELVDEVGKGWWSKPFDATYNLPPGDYMAKVMVHNPARRRSRPDGGVEPYELASVMYRMTVR